MTTEPLPIAKPKRKKAAPKYMVLRLNTPENGGIGTLYEHVATLKSIKAVEAYLETAAEGEYLAPLKRGGEWVVSPPTEPAKNIVQKKD